MCRRRDLDRSRWQRCPNNPDTDHLIALSKLQAFGAVAADVLVICAAPFGFELAVREAIIRHPRPRWMTASESQAKSKREEWLASVRADVISTLRGA